MARGLAKPVPHTTLRRATKINRRLFEALRRATEIRAVDLRHHLSTRFHDVAPWDPGAWASWFDPERGILTRPRIPDHERFWAVIAAAEESEEQRRESAVSYTDKVLRDDHAALDGFRFSRAWNEPAKRLFMARGLIRSDARRHLSRESRRLSDIWQSGHAQCKALGGGPCWEQQHLCGLTDMVQADGIREPWVVIWVAWLRHLQITGPRADRQWATTALKAVAKALYQVGSGDESLLTPEARATETRQRNRRAGAFRTLKRRYEAARIGLSRKQAYREAIEGREAGALAALSPEWISAR